MKRMYKLLLLSVVAAFLFTNCNQPQNENNANNSLVHSTPEAEDVSSQAIMDFVDAANKSSAEFHSFFILRHGKVVAEAYWNPYNSSLKHSMYSVSKSFTSTAIGFAVTEKLLTVNDKVISFFPDQLPDSISPNLAKLEVRHLLSMSVGQSPEPLSEIVGSEDDWVKAFLATPVVNEPGSVFLYNTLGVYVLSAIVQKVTGQKVVDYLKPRLFDPLGIEGYDWEVDPRGINTGGWGLRLKTEDMAKFGQLLLQKGKWNGKQIIPESWVEEATTASIDQKPDATKEERAKNSWVQGYGYLFWRCRHNAFRADGAYGQYIIVMPDQDAVVAIQAETRNMQEEINLVWDYLFPGIKDSQLPANKKLYEQLQNKLQTLALPIPEKKVSQSLLQTLNGATFELKENKVNWKKLSFKVNDTGQVQVTIVNDKGEYPVTFGSGEWKYGETSLLGPNLLLHARAHYAGIEPDKIAAAYTCPDENTLKLVLRYIETPHTETIFCKKDGNQITVDVEYSQPQEKIPPFAGQIAK